MSIDGNDPEKVVGSQYQQPFGNVPDSAPGIGGLTLGMKALGPNIVDHNRKANTNSEQVNPQTTSFGRTTSPVVDNILQSGLLHHTQGDDGARMDDDK